MASSGNMGVAVVTGASQGIGAVYARKLAERGHDVLLVARNGQRLERLAAEIRATTGRTAEIMVADLSKAAEVRALAARLRDDPRISILVNNAGASLDGGLLGSDAEVAADLIALNVTAPTLLAQAAAKAFIARRSGSIVNISSVTSFLPETFDGAYSGSKIYLLNLTLSLASKAKDSGVRFQAVLPGPTNTDMWARGGVPASVIPPERIMSPEDLVEAALTGLDRGEIVTAPTIENEGVWWAYETARQALGPHLAAGRPATRYLAPALAH
jgi:uncharacterized protein